MFSIGIITLAGRRISRARFVITGAVLGIVAAVIVACENPQPPVSCGAIPQQTLTVGETAMVSACFDDPNGDVLVYAARSSDPGVAKAVGSGSSVTVTAVSPGDAKVTIRADDPDGLTAEQMFAVLVPNRPPVVVGEIADRELAVGESLTLDVPGYFSEPDGQELVYAAALGADMVEGTMTGESLTMVALAKGTAPVTLTATDPGGLTATLGFSVTVPNRGPLARDTVATRAIEVGEAATVDMSPFFSDPDGDELAYTAVTSDGALATAEVSGSVIRVTAVAKGSVTVTVTATDTEGAAAAQSFGVTVPNRIPVAVGAIAAQTVEVGQEVSLEMGSFFTDPDGDPLAYEVATGNPAVASASAGDRAVAVTAVAKGSTTVTVTATDTEGSAATQSFAVTVPNRPPLAAGTIPARTMEAGDEATLDMASFFTDPDGDPLGYAVVVSDAAVVAASAAEGAVVLSAVAKGEATVTVTVTDTEGLTATQAFAVTVPNRAPVAGESVVARTIEVGEAATVDMSPHFSDPDGDELAYTAVTSDGALATAEVSGSVIRVTAVAKGSATVTVTATDTEGATAAQSFGVTVPNRVPVAVGAIAAQTVEVGQEVSLEMGSFFTDPDGDPLAYEVATGNPAVASASAGDRAVAVTAVAKGSTTVTVTATDTEGSAATQSFAVTVPNRPPLAAGTIPARTMEAGDEATLDMASFFTDPDGDPLGYAVVVSDAAVVAASAAEGAVVLSAVAKGEATVTVTVTDTEGLTATQAFAVTVPNRAPVAGESVVARTIEVGEAATVDMSPHFSDPDGDELAYTAVTSDGALATAEVSGSVIRVTAVAKGSATVTVTATDTEGATAAQSFGVTVPNRVPVAVGAIAAQTVEVGQEVSLEMGSFFSDPDGDALAYEVTTDNPAVAEVSVGELGVTVTALAKGNATMTVTATDIEGLTATQTLSVMVPNRPPAPARTIPVQTVEVGEEKTLDVASHFSDPDGDALSYAFTVSEAAVATIESTVAQVTVTAVARGEATVTVTATDTEGLAATLDFAVKVPNRVPVAMESIAARMLYKDSVTTVEVASVFMDPDGDALAYAVASSDSVVVRATATGTTVTVAAVGKGEATVTVWASDAEGIATRSFAVTVPNRAPFVPGRFSTYRMERDDTLKLGLAQYFADPDGDRLEVEAESSKERIVKVAVEGGSLVLAAGRRGTAKVTVTATDPEGLGVEQEFRVSVVLPGGGGGGGGNENQPPVVSGGIAARTVTDGEQFTVELGGHFSDPDGDPLTFSATSADEGMVGVVVSGSSLTVTGVGAGTADVTITASDLGNLTATVAFAVTVEEHTGGNRSPAVTRMVEKQDLEPEGTFETDLDDHFRDPDGDALAFSTSNSDDDVADVEVSDGDLMVTAVANGTAQVSVTARDPDGMNAKMDFTVQVRSPGDNRAPEVKGQGVLDKQFVPTSAYSMNAWWHFRDPDDDPLSYSVTSSNEAVARIEQDDPGHRHIRVRAVSDGESTITVKAEDPQGASLEQAFRFVVKNGDTPYVWEGRWITALPSMPGQVDTIAFSHHFWDDDRYGHGEVLRYSASSTDTAIVTVPTRYDYVDITGKAVGQATVTLTATDLAGESVSMSFVATVDNNRPPMVQREFPRLPHLPLGDTISFTLADYFEDPEDGDNFTYSDSTDGDKVWVQVSNGVLYIGTDSTTTLLTLRRIWITATDSEGKSVTQTFRVLVVPDLSDSDPEPQQLVLSSPALQRVTLLPRGRDPNGSPPAGSPARNTAA